MIEKAIARMLQAIGLHEIAGTVKDRLTALTPTHYLHRRKMLQFYGRLIKRGNLCFDIGANMGNRTEIFLKLGASVVAVEPQDVCMRYLRKKYGSNKNVTLIQKSLGEKEGLAEMLLSDAHTISSMRKEWIESVRASGRFQAYKWNRRLRVQVTTLDKLIEQYGRPDFCKIDVEGYEDKVINGLSQPVKMLSLEFTPEFTEPAVNAIRHLADLGQVRFNYSLEESMCLSSKNWVNEVEMYRILTSMQNMKIFGDIYARFLWLNS